MMFRIQLSTADLAKRVVISRVADHSRWYASSGLLHARILASDAIEPICAKTFKALGYELVEKPGIKKDDLLKIIGEYDGLVVRSATKVTKEVIEAGAKLKMIGRAGTGVDNIDVPTATEKGIFVVNTPGGNTISTAELTMGHILSLARNIPQAAASMKEGKWERSKYNGTELLGKTLGVIGVGKIGREVAKWCKGFGMNVVGYDPVISEDASRSYGIEPASLKTLLELSDFITIHTPMTKDTHHLLNATTLAQCKRGVRIVNCARGGIIDEDALLHALNAGQVAGAGLDVLEIEPPVEASAALRAHPNVVITPHLGASTYDAQERVAKAIAENMSDLLAGGRSYVGVVNIKQLKQRESALSKDSTAHSQGHIEGSRKPAFRPQNPQFSSGPCKKRPGYNLANLQADSLGRSHRSKLGKSQLKKAIVDTKRILGIPDDYLCGIVPASDTGAFEMALWNMLGAKNIDVCYWESFGKGWKDDVVKHLNLKKITREFTTEYGSLPDLSQTNAGHDIIFTYNGTTSGVCVPHLDWISNDRTGLTFNDATSAAFAMDIEWSKVDVTTFSWQKVLGGEGAHGMLILSPKAIERLESYDAKRPLPKIFRMTKRDKEGLVKVDRAIFQGDTINTPSMLCVEDYLDALAWSDSIGGLAGLVKRSEQNFAIIDEFVQNHDWISFLAKDPATRSNTSVCLTLKLNKEQVKKYVGLLESEGVAHDIGAYRDAPDGLRIWCGATVEKGDLEALLPWLSWAYEVVQQPRSH